MASETYDVFISYSRLDGRHAAEIDSILRAKGLRPFFDRRNMTPGLPWVRALEQVIGAAKAAVVLIGPHGLGNTQQYERELAFIRQSHEPKFPIVPVMLPGTTSDRPFDFLRVLTWVDFSQFAKVSDAPLELERLLTAIHGEPVSGEAEREAICPYRGLDAFREEDSAFFFGRGSADDRSGPIGELVAKIREQPFVMVVGRSGSGKSSLVYAGLLPGLRRERNRFWDVLSLRPGLNPLRSLAAAFNPRANDEGAAEYETKITNEADRLRAGDLDLLSHMIRRWLDEAEGKPDRLLLYVDQWEELYAQAPSSSDRERFAQHFADVNRFIDLLLKASSFAPVAAVGTVRADFYDRLIGHPQIRALLPTQQVLLAAMSRSELESTIVEPARKVGLTFDPPSLVQRILDEAGEDEGMLPLLQYALKESWALRKDNTITADGYARSGGVREAIRVTAERTFAALSAEDQQAARQLFLRLVKPGEGQQDTRARAEMPTEPMQRKIVEQFAGPRTRLLVTGSDRAARPIVEVSHEALIRTWPRLREWINANRDKLRARAAVQQAKADWEQQNRRDDLLLPAGFQLERARNLSADPGDISTAEIEEFISLSSKRDAANRKEKEVALARERAQVAKTRKLQKRVSWSLAAIFAIVITALSGALWQSYQTSKREAAVFASAAQVAFERAGICDRALRLAIAGLPPQKGASHLTYRSRELQDDLSLFGSIHGCYFRLALAGHKSSVSGAAFSPDGTRIVTTSDDAARVWDAKTGAVLAVLSGHTNFVQSPAFSPDGARIVTAIGDRNARVWDANTGAVLATLSGHTDTVKSAVFSPHGTRIVTASSDHTARVWDAKTGALLTTLSGHSNSVNSAVFSPDGTRILTSSVDGTARMWDAKTGALLTTLSGHSNSVNSAVFSPDGTRIVTASSDHTALMWDAKTGGLLATLFGHTRSVNSAAFSPDGTHVVTASSDHTARVWDAKTGALVATLSGHTSSVNSAAYSPDGTRIVTASLDNTARLWDAKNCRGTCAALAMLAGHTGEVRSATFSPDGRRILTASSDHTARVWDAKVGAALTTLSGGTDEVTSAMFSPNGKRIVTGSGPSDHTARVWDANTGALLATLSGHTNSVNAVFSSDGTRILTSSVDGTARVWDAKTGATVVGLPYMGPVTSAAFSRDGTRIVTASDNAARVWDAKTGGALATLSGHTSFVQSAAFSPDGTRIVTASSDHTARLWDGKTGAALATLAGHTGPVNSAAFSPDGTRIVTASEDKTARLWDGKTGAALATLSGHTNWVNGAAFSPDGTRIVTASLDGTARVWDAKTGAALATLSGHTSSVNSAAYSPDGTRIVTASLDNTARLWDAKTGAALAILSGHTGKVTSAAFSPDGTRVVTASDDNTARIWQIDPLVLMPPSQRQDYVCRERLVGAQTFTNEEMQDPILRGRKDLRNPCDRVGPFSPEYYWRAAIGLAGTIRGAFSK